MNSFVAFSGGVDSTALALLMKDSQPVFTDTGWEFPELYAHIDRFEQVTGREVIRISNEKFPGGIPQYSQHYNFLPNHCQRWCTGEFKINPMNSYLSDRLPAELLIGLRYDEDRRGNLTEMDGLAIDYPLRERHMTRQDCIDLCLKHNLLPHYPVYMARGGCKGCFYKRKSEVLAMAALVPDVMDELQALEESIQTERKKRFFYMFTNVGMSIAQIRQQPLLFDPEQVFADAANRTDMGTTCGLFCNR